MIGTRAGLASLASLLVAASALAEIAPMPRASLREHAEAIVIGTCTDVISKVSRRGGFEHTDWSHRLKIESIEKDSLSRLRVGDEILIASWNEYWVGPGLPPPSGSGHHGQPAKGGRARVYLKSIAITQEATAEAMLPNGWQTADRHIVLVGADDEYRSEVTMPLIADCLGRDAGVRATIAYPAAPNSDRLEIKERTSIHNLSALRDAEAGVLFLRWRELDAVGMSHLENFLCSGQPIVGLRTTTHMIRTGETITREDGSTIPLDDEIPIRVFGQKWISHHGHDSRTRVLAPDKAAADHAILRGVPGGFEVPSWLYDVTPLPEDCHVLLWGESVGGSSPGVKQPILWIRERGLSTPQPLPGQGTPARRMAFTTLGHPGDFEHIEVRRLVEQMILWALGDEAQIPKNGVRAEPSKAYAAPPCWE